MSQNESDETTQKKRSIGGLFNKIADKYDHVGPQIFSHFGKRMVDIARISAGSNVLDVATGRGALLFPAAEAVGEHGQVVGIDLAETMLQETSKELARLKMPVNIKVLQMDAEYLQFPDETFDTVLCGFAIFFFPQLNRTMSEFRRVLKPHGRICVSTLGKLVDEQWRWFGEIAKSHLPAEIESTASSENGNPQPVFDTPEGLRSILDRAGFESINVFPETKDFVYATNEEFWLSLWSNLNYIMVKRIKQTNGKEGLAKFKSEVFEKIDTMKQDDGFHLLFSALIGLATKP